MSHYCRGTQLSSSASLSSSLSSSSLSSDSSHHQEDVSGERDVCGGQDDSDRHWIAPSNDPVVMGCLLRRGDAPDKQGSSHEGNVDAGYPHMMEGE